MNDSLKIPPQSLESEKAFLGSIMLRPEAMYDVMDIISAETFYAERHKIIYRAMLEMHSKGIPIDMVSLSQKLKENKQLDKIGGSTYLTEIVESVPSSSNITHYADIVQKKYLLRSLIDASSYISGISYDESLDIEEVLDKAEKSIFKATNVSSSKSFTDIKDILGDAFERIETLSKTEDGIRGVPTGFKGLDNKLSGLQPSDLIILAARPSVGKTSLALDLVRNVAIRHNVPVGVFSLEMSAQQLIDRMLSAEAQVDSWRLKHGKVKDDSDFDKIRDALDTLSKAPIYIDDEPGNNILKMRSVARRLKSEKGLGLIVVDYLQLMSPTQSKNSDNVVQQITEISRSLKHLARELDVPVLALSQLSRAVESRGGKPRLSDLRDSGSIEQDADVVMFIHREDRYKEESEKTNIAEILIEKHRNGPTGKVDLYFDGDKTSFRDVDTSNYGDDLDDF